MRRKMSSICRRTIVIGWRPPGRSRRPGSVTSTAAARSRDGRLAGFELRPEPADRLLDLGLGRVGALAERPPLGRGQRLQLGEELRDQTLLAPEIAPLPALELGARGRHPSRPPSRKESEQILDGVFAPRPASFLRQAVFSACLATPTRCVKAAGSETASSASIFRLISLPAFFRPSISLL